MTLDLDHLRRVAEAADSDDFVPVGVIRSHIAAFDPPTVLALIERLKAAEAKVARVEALADLPATSDDWARIYNAHEEDDWYGTFVPTFSDVLRKTLSGDLTASEGDGGSEGHRDDDNAGGGRCGAQEGKA